MRSRFPAKQSKELRAAIDIQNKANKAAGVVSRKPQRVIRQEANIVRKELMHDATITAKQRSRAEQLRQKRLSADRELRERVKRFGRHLEGTAPTEKKTETGIVIPSGEQI